MKVSPIQNHLGQKKIFLCDKRFVVASCGRRFGKTFLAKEKLLYCLDRNKNHTYAYVAPTRGQAKDLMWNDLKQSFVDLKWSHRKMETELWILRHRTNSKIILRGADRPDRLRGGGYDGVIFDEFADITPETWEMVVRPTLSDRRGWCWFLGTPKGFNHFYDLAMSAKTKNDWAFFNFRTIDSPFFQTSEGKAELAQARLDLDEKSYKQEYDASFESFTGRVYYQFDRTRNVKSIKELESENWVGIDFNVDPFTAVIATPYENENGDDCLHIHNEIYRRNSHTDEISTYLKREYGVCKVVPDYTGIALKTSSKGESDISILKAHHEVHATINPHRVDRYNLLNTMFINNLLTIDPRCTNLINDCEKLCYKDGSNFPDDKNKLLGHITDALGYLAYKLFKQERHSSHSLR